MSDLMAEKITIVEDLYKSREPVPEMKAVYFMSPTSMCVDAFIADFKTKPKYKAAYVYFTDYCPDDLFNNMKLYCAKYIRVCKEINISFMPQEAQVFTCDNPGAFQSIYSPKSQDKKKTLEILADQLVTLCATLDEYPGVRYKKDSNVENAKILAELVDSKLATHYDMDDSGKKKGKTQAQLLIVERGFDPVSPILHELTYQAMAYDLIDIQSDTFKYKSKDGSEKQALLNEEDQLWVKLRHKHIAEVSEQIPKMLKEISASKKQPDGKITISNLAQMMKKMPSFRKQLNEKTIHLQLAEECMNHFSNNVEKLCKAEQDLAVGSDVEGVKVKDPMRTLLPVLLHQYSIYDKIRAVLLYIFSLNGTTDENLSKLIQHVNIENDREFILNWKELGVPIITSPSFFSRKPTRRDRSQEEKYNLSRWTPVIKDVMEDAVENKLDTKEWPHLSESPAAWNGSGAVSARQKHKASAQDDRRSGSRLIIFVLGGISFSEMRCAYEVTQAVKSCEVIIGKREPVAPVNVPPGQLNGPGEDSTPTRARCAGVARRVQIRGGVRGRAQTRQGEVHLERRRVTTAVCSSLQYYEGSFYKDYRHGAGQHWWPTGHRFTGHFYLNRKEGYGEQLRPDGATFKGLYHTDQRFGPGVVTYPDGRQDVGLWCGERLLRLCTSVDGSFSLKDFPEYAAYMDPAATADALTQLETDQFIPHPPLCQVHTDRDLPLDENFILPAGIENYSTNADYLPLPPGRRRELDQLFFGELWEPDAHPYLGYERDPLSKLPLQARLQAHIHKHRRQAENVGWDVAAVLSLNREGFGPKGPLEVKSELFIQHASQGERQAVSQMLQTCLVHPDVADSHGHTALIAASVNCHNDVIHLLLDIGADIDKLNCEGMSALAVCHVLYYPFQSLHTSLTEKTVKTQVLRSPSACGNSPQISQVDFTTDTPRFNDRPQTTNMTMSNYTNQNFFSDQTAEELTEHVSHHSRRASSDGELIAECQRGLHETETPADTEHLQEEERNKEEGEGGERDCKETEKERKVVEREEKSSREDETESRCGPAWENGESKEKEKEKTSKCIQDREEDVELGERRETESSKENMEGMGEVEIDVEKSVSNIHEEDVKEREERGSESVPGVERSIQVLDGHIALGSVQWKDRRAEAAGRVQQDQDKELTPKQTFDSARSVSSYNIHVTEEVMQRSAEALSHTGIPQHSDTQETVRKMAAMKTEHRVRLNTLKLLLERGADPNVSRVPMPVLFLAIMAADTEAVRRLLLCGARTDIPLPPEAGFFCKLFFISFFTLVKRKGLYPLHAAAALSGPAGPRITELLFHTVPDPDAQACDQDEIYEPDKAQESLNTDKSSHLREGGRTALHVACERESDYRNASKVVALLLSHGARTDLLWSGHSPLSLAIASGNDLAVEKLLNGGADPNIPLGHRVGSALCALANINYHLGGNRTKLLDMLAKAGANILMPVMVGDVVGTAVDYAHYSFSQDSRIANTAFHTLNMRERETFKARHQLLSRMGDLLRQTASQRGREDLAREQHLTLNDTSSTQRVVYTEAGPTSSNLTVPSCETEKHRIPAFKFCYHCGRSVSVNLTACTRCHKVYYCSRTCKLKAWDKRHKAECIRVSGGKQGLSSQQ
ncbi:hypothetical protein L3Q82_025526, partial [Scortum barcoo]